jgi:scyllo-inositol 2-dehydrogenase (NADP+)
LAGYLFFMNKIIKAGVAGYGMSAQVFHIPFLTTVDGYALTTILERSKSESKEKFPDVKIVRTIDELVADPNTDLIVITTPNDTHFEYASKALRAGKHVVLEKPFTNTIEEAKELISMAKSSDRIFSVYHNRRYVSDFLTIKKLVSENMLGQVHEYSCNFDRYRPELKLSSWREKPEPGSGILYDLGPHLIDQALVLFGLPKTITADIRIQRKNGKVDDYFNIWLDFGFTKAVLHSSMLVREMGPRYMVQGTLGSFIKYGDDPQEAMLKEGAIPIGDDWGREPKEFDGLLHTEINGEIIRKTIPSVKGNFGYYYTNLYQTIVNGAPLLEKPEHGYNTIRLIELALQSSNEKKTIVCADLI